ncbi:hypothetical protein Gasu2_29960 [Galdieria sulphuraria]|nr:hypothetical protein Gasu2_29960 [Galdieria sulphuraria]
MQRDIPTSTFGTGEWKNGSIVQTGYFQKASLQQKYTIRQIVKTFVLDDNKEIRVFAIMPNLALYNDMDPNFVEKLLEKTFATRKSFNTILQEMFNTCRSVKERLTIANRQARPPSLVSTPMNDKGVILAFDDNQLYVAYWNAITIIVVHFGQKARLLPPNEYFKNNWSLAKTHQIQVTRINLQPQDEYYENDK